MRRLARSLSRRVTSSRLRVLAYHEVNDAAAFRRHLEVLRENYSVIDGAAAVASVTSGRSLPDNPVWITFDDGYRSVVTEALPLLQEFGMPATLFVNPGTIETGDPHWWDLIKAASDVNAEFARYLGLSGSLVELKSVPDSLRRDAVELARSVVPPEEISAIARRVADRACLDDWTRAGMQVGNHTWDHACFDMCSPAQQENQITQAATWLSDEGYGTSQSVFAYPNGDRTEFAESILTSLGVRGACLFDHRLVTPTANELNISRLRISASAPTKRFRAVISGVHSAAFGALVRLGLRHRMPKTTTTHHSTETSTSS